jgi:hypothetical protein
MFERTEAQSAVSTCINAPLWADIMHYPLQRRFQNVRPCDLAEYASGLDKRIATHYMLFGTAGEKRIISKRGIDARRVVLVDW